MRHMVIGGLAICLALASMTVSAEADKVTICHATGSETNPYVEITIARQAWENGHSPHAVHVRDFLADGLACPPQPALTPTPSTTPTAATSVTSEPTTEPNTEAPSQPRAFPDSGGAPPKGD